MTDVRIEPPHPVRMHICSKSYQETITRTLEKFVPHNVENDKLPIVAMEEVGTAPTAISFYCLAPLRERSVPFFFDMVSRWLLPGQKLPVLFTYSADFRLPQVGDGIFTLCEMALQIESQEVLEQIRQNFPILQTEIALGMESTYYARRILDMRGMHAEQKIGHIHEHIAHLIKRLPAYFGQDIFPEMQHFLVLCEDTFKEQRSFQHLSKLVCLHYLFRRRLKEEKVLKRRLHRKVFRTELQNHKEKRPVVGIFIGMNFIREKEVFEESHFRRAVQTILPDVEAVPNSFFLQRRDNESLGTLYLEIEKKGGEEISSEEMQRLRKELPDEIEKRIEHLVHPVFMPRNEEEIMRNILVLTNQLRYVRDIPQVYLTFDEQTDSNLFYTVIFARILRKETRSLQELFTLQRSPLQYIHDRTRRMGYIRCKYPKEATVFRVRVSKERFLRQDLSINLYRARRFIVDEITSTVGPIRDFNGGMISKERETFGHVARLFEKEGKKDRLLLENFFYSITPVIMRSMIDPEWFRTLFHLLKKTIRETPPSRESYSLRAQKVDDMLFLLIQGESVAIKDSLQRVAQELQIPTTDFLLGHLWVHDVVHIGCISRFEDVEKQKQLVDRAEEEIEKANIRLRSGKQERMTDNLRNKILFRRNTLIGRG